MTPGRTRCPRPCRIPRAPCEVTGYNAARETGTRFVLRNPSEFVHRQLRVTGLTEMFGLSQTADSAQSHSP